MNTPIELHIGLDQALQSINSNKVSEIKPEEKDWVLNASVDEFLKSHISDKEDGFENTSIGAQVLNELMTSKQLTVYNEVDAGLHYVILPSDFYAKPKAVADVLFGCGDIKGLSMKYAIPMFVIPFVADNLVGKKFKSFSLTFEGDGTTVYNHYNANGYNSTDSKFMIIRDMLNQFNIDGYEIYWERYNNEYTKNSFIIVRILSNAILTKATIYYEFGTTSTKAFSLDVLPTYQERTIIGAVGTSLNAIPCRTISNKYINELLKDMLTTTRLDSPLANQIGQRLYIHTDSSFIIDKVNLHYIKKPSLISLEYGQMTELKDFSNEIIAIAHRRITAYIDDPKYNKIINENQISS